MVASTFPAPSSTSSAQPASFANSMLSRQRTKPVTCCTSSVPIVGPSLTACAVTLAISGTAGAPGGTRPSSSAMASAAGCIRAQWKGALTCSFMARPPHAHLLRRGNRPVDGPGMAADHDLAGGVVVGDGRTLRRPAPRSRPPPPAPARRRARPPSRRRRPAPPPASPGRAPSAAGRYRRARRRRSRTAPNIRRANGRPRSARPRRGRARRLPACASTARLTAMSAGWAFSVRTSSSPGPSNISRDRPCDSASSTSSKTSRATVEAPARSRPMPTAWEPCPGKTNTRSAMKSAPAR